ncbi:MAG TPA: site-specific integrase [Mycobacteriales bacterium]|nr:site-specific integrase [Mycobacteriales bacterium]
MTIEVDLLRGERVDLGGGRELLGDYLRRWLAQHPRIGPRWRETCERNLRLHLAPLESVRLRDLTPTRVRTWHADALAAGGGPTSIAQSYRFLRAALNGAVDDGLIPSNPCRVRGAGADRAPERPVATVEELGRLIEATTPRHRAAVALAGWCGLRRGEILALQRRDLDLSLSVLRVKQTQTEMLSSKAIFDSAPKTQAGYRSVAIPPHVIPVLEEHLATFAGPTRVFVGRDGGPLRGDALRQSFERARTKVGLEHLRFHDLRPTGQTLAAAAGASLADLMRRLGHASPAAARRYLHASDDRDQQIARALSDLVQQSDPTDRRIDPGR